MNYKERFLSKISQYEKVQKQLREENEEFNKDGIRSEDEVKENLERIESLNKEELKKLRTDLEAILSDKREDLGCPSKKALDKDYELRLKNLITVFTRDGKEMSKENLEKALVLFKDDPFALYKLKAALVQSGLAENEAEELITLDKSDINIAQLDMIEESFNDKLNISSTVNVADYLGFEPLLNELDEDLNYIG